MYLNLDIAETLNFAIDFLGVSAGFCINNRERVKSFNYLTETVFFRKSENLTETFFFSSTFCELFFCL